MEEVMLWKCFFSKMLSITLTSESRHLFSWFGAAAVMAHTRALKVSDDVECGLYRRCWRFQLTAHRHYWRQHHTRSTMLVWQQSQLSLASGVRALSRRLKLQLQVPWCAALVNAVCVILTRCICSLWSVNVICCLTAGGEGTPKKIWRKKYGQWASATARGRWRTELNGDTWSTGLRPMLQWSWQGIIRVKSRT